MDTEFKKEVNGELLKLAIESQKVGANAAFSMMTRLFLMLKDNKTDQITIDQALALIKECQSLFLKQEGV